MISNIILRHSKRYPRLSFLPIENVFLCSAITIFYNSHLPHSQKYSFMTSGCANYIMMDSLNDARPRCCCCSTVHIDCLLPVSTPKVQVCGCEADNGTAGESATMALGVWARVGAGAVGVSKVARAQKQRRRCCLGMGRAGWWVGEVVARHRKNQGVQRMRAPQGSMVSAPSPRNCVVATPIYLCQRKSGAEIRRSRCSVGDRGE